MKWCDPRQVLVSVLLVDVSLVSSCVLSIVSLLRQVYSSLDYESRYVGKEIIGLGCRFGKSGMAITLFLLATWYDDASLLAHHSMIALAGVSLIWLGVSLQLNNLIKTSEKTAKRD